MGEINTNKLWNIIRYLIKTGAGSLGLGDRIKAEDNPDKFNADLHAHPYIDSLEALLKTVKAARNNNIDLIGVTVHGKGNNKELNYWDTRKMMIGKNYSYLDYRVFFQMRQGSRLITFTNGFEENCKLKGLKDAKIDIVGLMCDQGLEEKTSSNMEARDYIDLIHQHNGIAMAAHPTVLPTGRLIAFRLPEKEEMEILEEKIFPYVDCADNVADAALWMICSHEILEEHYENPLRTSDAHCTGRFPGYTRGEIGRAWTSFHMRDIGHIGGYEKGIFSFDGKSKEELGNAVRDELKVLIKNKRYETGGGYTPLGQFVFGTALPMVFKD